MMVLHRFDDLRFKQLRLKWMLYMMIPSLLLDAFFLHIVLVDYPALVAAGQMQDITSESVKLFLVNAIILKGGPAFWYYSLKFNRGKSSVNTSPQKVVYERLTKSQLEGISIYVFDTLAVTSVSSLEVKKSGSVVVKGHIVKHRHDGEKTKRGAQGKPAEKKMSHLVIPGYFEDMHGIVKALENLKMNTG